MLVGEKETLRFAIAVVDTEGMAAIVDAEDRLRGVLSSGDVYRAIFSGSDLDQPAVNHCNREPVFLSQSDLKDPARVRPRLRDLLDRSGLFIPIVDSEGRVVDVVHHTDLEGRMSSHDRVRGNGRLVLIIGGAGYLGSQLTELLLERGYSVRILDNFTHRNRAVYDLVHQEALEIINGDVRDIRSVVSALEGVSSVVLLAAVVGDPASQANPKQTVEINYLSAKMVAEACKYAHVKRLLFASTCSVYGAGPGVLTEEDELRPVSHYAKTKIAAEQAILSIANTDFQPTIMRMATLYGLSPKMRFDLVANIFSRKAIQEGRIEVFGGRQWRPLLHVSDGAQAFVEVLEAPLEKVGNQVFNIGSEEHNVQIISLAEMVGNVIPDTEVVVLEGSEDARDYRVSFERLRGAVGLGPLRDLPDAIREMGDYVNQHRDDDFDSDLYNNHSLYY